MLLEHTVGNLDPLYIVNMVPNGLEIPRLRDRLVKSRSLLTTGLKLLFDMVAMISSRLIVSTFWLNTTKRQDMGFT